VREQAEKSIREIIENIRKKGEETTTGLSDILTEGSIEAERVKTVAEESAEKAKESAERAKIAAKESAERAKESAERAKIAIRETLERAKASIPSQAEIKATLEQGTEAASESTEKI